MGQLILAVDGHRVEGMQHQDVARLIAESFAQRDKPVICGYTLELLESISHQTGDENHYDYC